MKTLGIIAGNGLFPVLTAKRAKQEGYRVVSCAIVDETSEKLLHHSDSIEWIKVGQLKKLIKYFRSEDVTQAVMAGKIEKVNLFQKNVSPDLDMVKVLVKTKDFKDDSLLVGIADYLESHGIKLLDSTLFMKDAMPGEGVLGKKKPNKEVQEDAAFGFQMAKAIAGLDFGQTVVVKKKAVMAAEAIEGTDKAIVRGGELGGEGVTVVKVSKPDQDMRFDVPAVGLRTMERLIEIKAEAFAFEAKKTLFLDQEDFIYRANKHGISLIGIEGTNDGN